MEAVSDRTRREMRSCRGRFGDVASSERLSAPRRVGPRRATSVFNIASPAAPVSKTINSVSHPLKISWLAEADLNSDCVLRRVAMTSCPGKQLKLGRDGFVYDRCLGSDIKFLKTKEISMIVCLLNQAELSSLGVNLKKYAQCAEKLKVEFIHFPVVEMAPFENMEQLYDLCSRLSTHLADTTNRVLIHCRGGMGRTGTLAACYLLFQRKALAQALSHKKAIAYVRHYRSPRAIESRKQEDCVRDFAIYCAEGS